MTTETESKRRHPRRDVDLWAIERGDGFTSWHRVRNVSRDGLYFESAMPLPEGTPLHLDIELPGRRILRAEVAVVHASISERESGIGVRIVELDPEDRDALIHYSSAH